MDVRKLASEIKAKALADLKAAEEMEQAAAKIEQLAAEHGWQIDIRPAAPVAGEKPSAPVRTRVMPTKKKGGKPANPNSVTARSKTESVKIVRKLNRPVPLGEMIAKLESAGIKLGGKNPNQALSANLGHTPELVSTKRGWWLAGVPLPPEDKSPKIGGGEQDIFGGLN